MIIVRFSVTVIVSTLLGVILGTSASFIPPMVNAYNHEPEFYAQVTQPIVLSENECCAVYEKAEEGIDEKITYSIKEEAEATSEPVAQVAIETTPEPLVQPQEEKAHSLNPEVILSLINEKRAQANLAPLEKDEKVCEVANLRAPELSGELAKGQLHAGFYGRHLPYPAAENVIYMRSEEAAVDWWMNSSVHRRQLLGDYKYTCVACSGESCTEIFANSPKS